MTTKKWIFIGIITAFVLFWVWFIFIRMTKPKAISVILKNIPSLSKTTLESFGSDYLIARAKALNSKQPSFELNGKMYNTQTGKAL